MTPKNYISFFKSNITKRVLKLFASEFEQPRVDPTIFKFETPPDEKMGHLAFACFPLAKIACAGPQQIADILARQWGGSDYFQKIVSAGPYLNFFFSPEFLTSELLTTCINDARYGESDQGSEKTIMVEYSSPNTNKPMHLGHCRNNLLGISLSNLLENTGYRVIKANLINDRGIHICKSMYAYQRWGNGETPESTGIKGDKLVGKYYVLYDQKEKAHPDILKEVQQMLRDWENGDSEVRALWQKMNGWVLDGFYQSYDRMGATFDKIYRESETYQGGKEVVYKALEAGTCEREANGAISIDLEANKLGKKILLRGDRTAMYITQDINTTITKFTDYKLNGSLFVVADEQNNHFRVLFKILEKFGYDWAKCCEHVSYGMITLPEGKMKSREGTVVDLDDLMDKMKTMAKEELESRYHNNNITEEIDIEETAEAISQSAIKFYILKTNASKEISFNREESLSFDGATGPYLQYTHARISSLLKKLDFRIQDTVAEDYHWQEEEIKLMVLLSRFPDAVLQSINDRNPAVICSFVYDLCRSYNKFYHEHPILKADQTTERNFRVMISQATQKVLAKALNILSIKPLERM